MNKIFALFTAAAVLTGCGTEQQQPAEKTKNIIMIVADGMGPAYTSAYRYYNDNPDTDGIEPSIFDEFVVGSVSTYPASVSGYVTDSAAGATALATGHKSYNGAISVDVNKQPLETVLQVAKQQGKRTGVVVTSQVNHATPASYITHNEYRRNMNAIADSYIDNGINSDVILGGGWQYFIREDRNLVEEFKQQGFQYIDSYDQLAKLDKNKPALGLFADKGLPWALDDSNRHRLSMMTKAALPLLENDNGYFVLIEASQVDWGGHSNDIASAMAEMDDLAQTLIYLKEYVKTNPDTLVVLTADHSTGGFTIGSDGQYKWSPHIFKNLTMSPVSLAKLFVNNSVGKTDLEKELGFEITDQEWSELTELKQQKLAESGDVNPAVKAAYKMIKQIISSHSNTGWTTSGHTGIDVPVFAFGAGSQQFVGLKDNTDIAKQIFTILKK